MRKFLWLLIAVAASGGCSSRLSPSGPRSLSDTDWSIQFAEWKADGSNFVCVNSEYVAKDESLKYGVSTWDTNGRQLNRWTFSSWPYSWPMGLSEDGMHIITMRQKSADIVSVSLSDLSEQVLASRLLWGVSPSGSMLLTIDPQNDGGDSVFLVPVSIVGGVLRLLPGSEQKPLQGLWGDMISDSLYVLQMGDSALSRTATVIDLDGVHKCEVALGRTGSFGSQSADYVNQDPLTGGIITYNLRSALKREYAPPWTPFTMVGSPMISNDGSVISFVSDTTFGQYSYVGVHHYRTILLNPANGHFAIAADSAIGMLAPDGSHLAYFRPADPHFGLHVLPISPP